MKSLGPVALVFGALALVSASLATGASSADPLWQKALAVARTNDVAVAGLVITRSEVVLKGETNGVHELWERSTPGPQGAVVTKTIKVLEDGKDITAKEVKKQEKQEKQARKENGKAARPSSGNPFDAEVQDRLTLVVTNQTRTIAGQDCVGYLFQVRNTNGPTTRGVAWIAKETGEPQEIDNMTLDPLPDKRLKQVTTVMRYETTTNGWHIKELQTTGRISVLFMQAEFHSVRTFSDYWRRQ